MTWRKKAVPEPVITQRKFGWKRPYSDILDFKYPGIGIPKPDTELPELIDMRPKCSPVEDQLSLGSCVGNAIVGNLEYVHKNFQNIDIDFSRLFLYYLCRRFDHNIQNDDGTTIRQGMRVLEDFGCCDEVLWPYDLTQWAVSPYESCFKAALVHKTIDYFPVKGIQEMLNTLASGLPFVFGMSVYDSFMSPQVARTGIVPYPELKDTLVGGHACLAVGYNLKEKFFICKNSWGKSWGMDGYFTIDFKYAQFFWDDCWCCRS